MNKRIAFIYPLVWASIAICAALLAFSGPNSVQAQDVRPMQVPTGVAIPVAFQQGVSPHAYAGCQDTHIVSWYGYRDYNYCNSSALEVRSGDQQAALVRFDVSSIPTSATILSAELRLYVEWTSGGGMSLPIGVYKMNRQWTVCEATWYSPQADLFWRAAGANHIADDRDASPVSSATVSSAATWYSWDVAPLVQSWVGAPGSNYGMALKSFFTEYSVGFGFVSANHGGAQLRPKLDVVYILLPDTPTPTVTFTATPTPTHTPTATRTATATLTATRTATATETPTVTLTLTRTPTSTITQTPTSTPTLTVTQTPTITPTATPTVVGMLVGSVLLQGRGPAPGVSWRVPLTVSLYQQDVLHYEFQVMTEDDGSFRVANIRSDFYDVAVKNPYTLRNRREGVLIVPGVTSVFMGTLLAGDANDDNHIDIVDFSIFRANFGLPSATGDFNGDGFVDIGDFSLLRANFGLYGDMIVAP